MSSPNHQVILGELPTSTGERQLRGSISYSSQEVFDLTVVQNIFLIRRGFSLARFVPTYCLAKPLTVSATQKSFKLLHLPMILANGSTVSTALK